MAVDTAQKRRSMISFARMNYAERVPEATDFDSDEDRVQALWLYAGISLYASITAADTPIRVNPRIGPTVVVNPTVRPLLTVNPTLSS